MKIFNATAENVTWLENHVNELPPGTVEALKGDMIDPEDFDPTIHELSNTPVGCTGIAVYEQTLYRLGVIIFHPNHGSVEAQPSMMAS